MVLLGYGEQVKSYNSYASSEWENYFGRDVIFDENVIALNKNDCDPDLVKKVIVQMNRWSKFSGQYRLPYSLHNIEDSLQELRRSTRENEKPNCFERKHV
uniref:Uncharacterized protein n=1 Tax=Lepeophtheirus salmonis TaxID=72036 RepID=A0A0K2UTX4_LEPSM